MPIDRTTLKRGPAIVTIGGVTITPQDEVTLDAETKTFDVNSATSPNADRRVDDEMLSISLTPDGQVSADLLAVYYDCLGYTRLGQSIVGADAAITIHWQQDGELLTFPAGAITKVPSLTLAPNKPAFGPMTISLVGKNNTAWTDAAKRMTVGTADFVDSANRANILTEAASSIAWGNAAPWNALATQDGITFDFELETDTDETPDEGVVDIFFQGLSCSATLTPKNATTAQIMTATKLQGAGSRRGVSLNARSLGDLTAHNSGLYVILHGAAISKYPVGGGRKRKARLGEMYLQNTKAVETTAVAYVGTAAPEA